MVLQVFMRSPHPRWFVDEDKKRVAGGAPTELRIQTVYSYAHRQASLLDLLLIFSLVFCRGGVMFRSAHFSGAITAVLWSRSTVWRGKFNGAGDRSGEPGPRWEVALSRVW